MAKLETVDMRGVFSEYGAELVAVVSAAKIDRDLKLAILAWVGYVEGAMKGLRAQLPEPVVAARSDRPGS